MRVRALSPREAMVLTALSEAAERGARCPSNEELADLCGYFAVASPPGVIGRLAAMGLISVRVGQKERQVTIMATGKSTAPMTNAAPHWRNRPRNVPTPSLDKLRQQRPDDVSSILLEARRVGRAPADFLADLVWRGWAAHQGEAMIQSDHDVEVG